MATNWTWRGVVALIWQCAKRTRIFIPVPQFPFKVLQYPSPSYYLDLLLYLLWVNLIMDTLGALALADPPNDGLMERQHVKRTESFITKTIWKDIIGQSVYQIAVLFVLNFAGKPILNLLGHNATAIPILSSSTPLSSVRFSKK